MQVQKYTKNTNSMPTKCENRIKCDENSHFSAMSALNRRKIAFFAIRIRSFLDKKPEVFHLPLKQHLIIARMTKATKLTPYKHGPERTHQNKKHFLILLIVTYCLVNNNVNANIGAQYYELIRPVRLKK